MSDVNWHDAAPLSNTAMRSPRFVGNTFGKLRDEVNIVSLHSLGICAYICPRLLCTSFSPCPSPARSLVPHIAFPRPPSSGNATWHDESQENYLCNYLFSTVGKLEINTRVLLASREIKERLLKKKVFSESEKNFRNDGEGNNGGTAWSGEF